jgi:hypothetical protein
MISVDVHRTLSTMLSHDPKRSNMAAGVADVRHIRTVLPNDRVDSVSTNEMQW